MGLLGKILFSQKKEEVLNLVDKALGRIEQMKDGFKIEIPDDFRRGVGCALMSVMDELCKKEVIDMNVYDAVKNRLGQWYSSS